MAKAVPLRVGEKITCGDFHHGLKERMDQVHALRDWRAEHGKTQADIAEAVSVQPSHISQIENGLKEPSLALAAKLSRETGIPIDKFVKLVEAAQ